MIPAILQLFESSAAVANAQLEQADLQQSIRVGQAEMVGDIRLVGRGGLLPTGPIASNAIVWAEIACLGTCDTKINRGMPIRFDSNVPVNTRIQKAGTGAGSSPFVAPGTDVLVVRGIITRPVWMVRYAEKSTFTYDAGSQVGKITIENRTPVGNLPQDLNEISTLLAGGTVPEAIFMTSSFSDEIFGIGRIDYNATSVTTDGTNVTGAVLGFKFEGDSIAEAYASGSVDGVFPLDKFSNAGIGKVGVLEEYRFYIRQEVVTGGFKRYLTRARMLPGIEEAYPDPSAAATNPNLLLDVADNMLDLQVALGFDCNADGMVDENADGAGDEWLGNNTADFAAMTAAPWTDCFEDRRGGALSLVRITTVAHSRDPQRNRQTAALVRIEDKDYTAVEYAGVNDVIQRLYLRVNMTTVVDMRNL
jgi:hypothetical protein